MSQVIDGTVSILVQGEINNQVIEIVNLRTGNKLFFFLHRLGTRGQSSTLSVYFTIKTR